MIEKFWSAGKMQQQPRSRNASTCEVPNPSSRACYTYLHNDSKYQNQKFRADFRWRLELALQLCLLDEVEDRDAAKTYSC